MSDEQALQQHDMEQLQQAALEALQASLQRPLTQPEAMALAYSAGVANEFYRSTSLKT